MLKSNKYNERIGKENLNINGELMKVIEYNGANDMVIEFQDENKSTVHCTWQKFQKGGIINPYIYKCRLGQEKYNHQNCLMKIVEYNNTDNIIVEFQDEYRTRVHTQYNNFLLGNVKNPYFPSVFNVGIIGNKYNKNTKEYTTWTHILERSYDNKIKEKYTTYQNVTCCKEWLLYENFYEWLHEQENFDKWYNNKRWAIDKDILVKGNKIYSPATCCLVPNYVNCLFVKSNSIRSNLPVGVHKHTNKYQAMCNNPFIKKLVSLGLYDTSQEAFQAYKKYKENLIKQMACIEYSKNNISKICFDAMMSYEI